MEVGEPIKHFFSQRMRLHSPPAELSVKKGECCAEKDFSWFAANVPCRSACPADTDIPGYLTAVSEGRFADAYRINLRDNVFPAVLGRVCARPCEAACRHGYEGLGEPVSICFSKRSSDDLGKRKPVVLEPWFPETGKRIAIVGSGVAGLAAARNLRLMGHRVVVYERHAKPGGMLNQGIPEFRLPRDIIDREIDQITRLGVEIKCNTAIGKEIAFSDLQLEFDAVIIAAGTLLPNMLDLPGKTLPGIRHGLDFLLEVNESGTADIGKNVLVIGGGFTAMDCARTAQRLGAKIATWNLKVLYRRGRENMRITPGELDELDAEGIPLECHASPVAYLEKDGRLSGMRFRRTGTHEEFDVPADAVLLATGQFRTPFEECAGHANVFTAGDFETGATTLVDAIGHAKATVRSVDEYLMGEKRMGRRITVEDSSRVGRSRKMDDIPQQPMPALELDKRDLNAEVELGYENKNAVKESQRCYRCNHKFEIDQDKCIKCDLCLISKARPECILMLKRIEFDDGGRATSWEPTDSVLKMKFIWINQDECIRCGACYKACPVDAISLQKVALTTRALV